MRPVDRLQTMQSQKIVGFRKVLTFQETVIKRQWAWMNGFEYEMLFVVDEPCLGLGVSAPQHKYYRRVVSVEQLDNSVGKYIPTVLRMRQRLTFANTEVAVE